MPAHFPLINVLALAWFALCWRGYVAFSRQRNKKKRLGLIAAMDTVRERWAQELLKRDNRIVDSQVINGLVRKETFFASTTLLILASTVALLGLGAQVNQIFSDVPFVASTSPALWGAKVVVLALIFVFAFFKFTWSIRQHSYCAIVMAAMPLPEHVSGVEGKIQARQLARLSSLAARHFNDGLRAYYFALAELSWFFHPVLFIVASCWVTVVLYRREFHSNALGILTRHTVDKGG